MSNEPDGLLQLGEVFVATQRRLRDAVNDITGAQDFETLVEADYIVRNFFELLKVLTERVDAIALYLGVDPH